MSLTRISREFEMKKIYPYILVLFVIPNVFANDGVKGCLSTVSTLSGPIEMLNKELTSCGYNKGLAELEKVKKDQEKYVLEKLASKLALQINQNLEETAFLTNFFNSNGDDLLMKEADTAGNVKRECSLSQMKEIEKCGGTSKGSLYDMKLNFLKKNLNPTNKKSKYGDGLFGILADKYTSNLGVAGFTKNNSNLQCPLDGEASGFSLTSQLDEISAEQIVKTLQTNKDPLVLKELFDNYGQLKFIRDAEKIDDFIKYISGFNLNKNKSSAKIYIANFFKDKKNQKEFFAPTMANECSKVTKNINKFLCSDLDELGSIKKDNSKMIFNGLEVKPMDDQLIDFDSDDVALRAYGFQCIALAKSKIPNDAHGTINSEQKLDDWYDGFTKNTRPEVSVDNNIEKKKLFCANYSCSSEDSKGSSSCKSGGPLLSSDLKKIMQCDLSPLGKKCDSDALKAIDYMEGNEKLRFSIGNIADVMNSSSQSQEDIQKAKSSLPDFAENFLGIEGSLIALGKPVTPIMIAEKMEDFKERKLNSEIPPYKAPNPERTEYAKNDKAESVFETAPSIPRTPNEYTSTVTPTSIVNRILPSGSTSQRIEGVRRNSKNDYWTDDLPETTKKDKTTKTSQNDSATPGAQSSPSTQNSEFTKQEFENYKSEVSKEVNANRSKISAVSGELARTQQELASQRAEMERRFADLERKQNEFKDSSKPKEVAEVKSLKKEADTLKSDMAKLDRAPASISSGSGGLIVTPESLKTLSEVELQKRGVDIDESFVISIKIKDKNGINEELVNVAVIRHNTNGKSYLIPRYEGKNEEIIKAIEKSPLFSDFIKVVKTKMKSFASLRDIIKL